MASSFFTESEAPRDFRVSSTESDGHYTKCLLCYTVKRNFYCPECIRTGNFVHSSMPYADRYAEKQAKLLRVKANRKYILDRCEKLLRPKLKKDTLLTEAKQSRDRLDLLRLAIDQRKNNIEQKKRELTQLKNYNNELQLKLPRYQKRVATLGKHAQHQSIELQNKICVYNDQVESLAALRRSRIRQLTRYIFPIYMTYDASDSIEDMEFIGSDTEEEPPPRAHLHIVAPWITTDGDLSNVQAWLRDSKEPSGGESVGAGGGGGGGGGEGRVPAALALAAQLLALLAWTLDVRLPHALALTEYSRCRAGGGGGGGAGGVEGRARRVCAGAAALALHAAPHCCGGAPRAGGPGGAGAPHPLAALHALVLAAVAGDPALGRAERWSEHPEAWCEWAECWTCSEESVDAEPEHLTWPDCPEPAEGRGAPAPTSAPAPAASLVTSAAASLASMWRGWTK